MSDFYDYVLEDLDLKRKRILDAAVGAGRATFQWARAVHEQEGTGKILAIDIELTKEWVEKIRKRLGRFGKYVELREGDIFKLGFVRDGTMDIVNCDDTIIFLNPRPMKLLAALKEFHRVLKPGGILIIVSELPIEYVSEPADEGQWRRWNFAKAIYDLKGEQWSCEPYPEETKLALGLVGFEVYEERVFPKCKNVESHLPCIDEWRDVMLKDIKTLHWGEPLKKALVKSVDEVYGKVVKDGFIMNPGNFVLKCKKR
jgi:SAM-dependent methyltransferase